MSAARPISLDELDERGANAPVHRMAHVSDELPTAAGATRLQVHLTDEISLDAMLLNPAGGGGL